MKEIKILVIEDEEDIRELITYHLHRQGLTILPVSTAEEGLKILQTTTPDLILLDRMLPGMSGEDFCRLVKRDSSTSEIPIIMVTAKGGEQDVVAGFDLGADDYVAKPFSFQILVSRVKANLRRRRVLKEDVKEVLKFSGLSIDPVRREVLVEGRVFDLTQTEFDILYLLASSPGKVFSRYQIVDRIKGEDSFIGERTVDVHMASLRKKLKRSAGLIKTARGVGYSFKEEQ